MVAQNLLRLDRLQEDGTRSLKQLCVWGEMLSGEKVHRGGSTTVMTGEQWLQRWRASGAGHAGR